MTGSRGGASNASRRSRAPNKSGVRRTPAPRSASAHRASAAAAASPAPSTKRSHSSGGIPRGKGERVYQKPPELMSVSETVRARLLQKRARFGDSAGSMATPPAVFAAIPPSYSGETVPGVQWNVVSGPVLLPHRDGDRWRYPSFSIPDANAPGSNTHRTSGKLSNTERAQVRSAVRGIQ